MKIKPWRPSPAMAVALLALFLAAGGNVVAYGLGRNSVYSRDIVPGAVRANDLGRFRLRTSGPILDRDTTPHDRIYGEAGGRAKCKPGERLITGGSQQRGGEADTPYMRIVEDGPVPVERAWQVRWASDLGGAASQDFVVFAVCLVR